jgi:glycosyltransferase involved in cell wall biosynthesis
MVSIVIPVFNGADLVDELYASLAPVLDSLDDDVEVVLVDDGSRDETVERLQAIQRRDPRIQIVELATNFGQHAAFAAGFAHARGEYLVTMDADLQCDPGDVPRLLQPLREGYDVVSGVRLRRRDPLLRRIFSRALTWLVGRMVAVRLRDIGCPFNALTGEVARGMGEYGELQRFLKPIGVLLARRVAEVEVEHRARPRVRPHSSYSTTALIRPFMDFFVNGVGDVFAWLFVAAAGLAGIAAVTTAAAIAAMAAGASGPALAGAFFAITLFAAVVALLGLAGDYVQRIHRQSTGRPFYLVRRVHTARAAGDQP